MSRRRIRIFKRHRHLKRYRQIISVLTRNGFGLLLDQIGIYGYLRMRRKRSEEEPQQTMDNTRLSIGERLRRSCEELGPTFVKIGQILSTRPDVFSPEVTSELEKLQEAVHPFGFTAVEQVIREEFEEDPDTLFESFNREPLAAASLSQVHRATVAGGHEVVVKVQRPGIQEQIEIDLEILEDFVSLLVKHTRYGEFYDFAGMLHELKESLNRELDFRREGENADRFRRNLSKEPKISVPDIRWVYTTTRVLTMSYVDGMRITQTQALKEAGIDCRELGTRLAHNLINQILRDGFFHADPHPGNLAIQSDGTIVYLDLGMTGQLSRIRRRQLSRMFIGIAGQNAHQVVAAISDMGTMKQRTSLSQFEREIELLLERYLSVPISQLDLGELLARIFQLAYAYKVQIPGELTLMAKVMLTLQGVLDQLDPELNLMALMKPMASKLIWDVWSFDDIEQTLQRGVHDYGELLRHTPEFLLNLQRKIEDDGYSVQLGIKNIERFQKQLDRITNRLSFSMILLAVCLIIAGLIIGTGFSAGSNPEINTFYVLMLRVGLGVAVIIVLGLLLSMFRSRKP